MGLVAFVDTLANVYLLCDGRDCRYVFRVKTCASPILRRVDWSHYEGAHWVTKSASTVV